MTYCRTLVSPRWLDAPGWAVGRRCFGDVPRVVEAPLSAGSTVPALFYRPAGVQAGGSVESTGGLIDTAGELKEN
jgi:hypothetical protein